MRYWKSFALSVFALIGIGLFQNCGKKNFSDDSTTSSSTGTQATSSTDTLVDSGTTATTLVPNQNYSVTCESQAMKTQTLTGKVGNSANTLVAMAPSGEGFWAITVTNGKIVSASNCVSDQSVVNGAGSGVQYDHYGVSACIANARAGRVCSKWGSCTYAQGAANDFLSCTYQ